MTDEDRNEPVDVNELPQDPVTMPSDSEEAREIKRVMYEAQLQDYARDLEGAQADARAASNALASAIQANERATARLARLEGRMEALRSLAARDGISL